MLSREERARQFMPFDALKGLNEALREKEKEYIERKELSEEEIDKISESLKILESGNVINIVYYSEGRYLEEKFIIKQIDSIGKKIVSENEKHIKFIDILKIDII